jgi:peptide/nickel transport system substrate-binding protein
VEKASKLLDEAGFPKGPDGMRFELNVIFNVGMSPLVALADSVKSYLDKVGIKVVPIPMDDATFKERAFVTWNFDMFLMLMGTGADPIASVGRFYHSSMIKPMTYANFAPFNNSKVDRAFDMASEQTTPEKAAPYLAEAQKILWDELPSYPLWDVNYPTVVRKEWKGVGLALHEEAGVWMQQEKWWDKGKPITPPATTTTIATTSPTVVTGIDPATFGTIAVVIVAAVAIYLVYVKRYKKKAT